jgi:hypothetical protein
MWVAHCKNCNQLIKFEPRIRFLHSKEISPRDISGGAWKHDTSKCRIAQPTDGRSPIADVEFHSNNPTAWSYAINGANPPKGEK